MNHMGGANHVQINELCKFHTWKVSVIFVKVSTCFILTFLHITNDRNERQLDSVAYYSSSSNVIIPLDVRSFIKSMCSTL